MILIRQSYRYLILLTLTLGLFLTACGDSTSTSSRAAVAANSTTSAQTGTLTTASTTTTRMSMPLSPGGTSAGAGMPGMTPGMTMTMQMGSHPTVTPDPKATPTDPNLTLVNKNGSKTVLTKQPQRIVCVVPTCAEMLAQLGLVPMATDDFAGGYLKLPYIYGDKASQLTGHIGGTPFQQNVEDIAKFKPDLVIGLAGGSGESLVDPLKTIAPLWLVYPQSYQESEDDLRQLGRVTGHSDLAEAEIKKFEDKLAAYKAKSPKNKSVIALNVTDAHKIFIEEKVGPNCSLLAEVAKCEWSVPGGTGMHAGIVQYSFEQLLKDNPDMIFAYAQVPLGGATQSKVSKLVGNDPLWKNLSAVKNGKVFDVDAYVWNFNYGLRTYTQVLDTTMPKIYPEVFPQPLP